MAAVQLRAKPTDEVTILYNLAFSAIDGIHDGHGPARNAMIDNPMFKEVSKPITDNPRLKMTNEVVTKYPFTNANISNITHAFGPATLGFPGSTNEDAYKLYLINYNAANGGFNSSAFDYRINKRRVFGLAIKFFWVNFPFVI